MGEVRTTSRTPEEKRQQLRELAESIIGGTAPAEAVKHHIELNGLSIKRGRADLAQVRQRWARQLRDGRKRKEENAGLVLVRLDSIHERAMQAGDLATALCAEVERSRLLGLHPNS